MGALTSWVAAIAAHWPIPGASPTYGAASLAYPRGPPNVWGLSGTGAATRQWSTFLGEAEPRLFHLSSPAVVKASPIPSSY